MKRFLQTPAMIVILNEDLTYRQIFMDGRALETDPNPSWMGYSVGHWDGDTLVVESTGFNDRTWLLGGYPHTEALRMTERYRRTDFGHLEIAVTFQDPGAYSKPWTVQLARSWLPTRNCSNPSAMKRVTAGNSTGSARLSDIEKSEVKVAPEVLAKYVGVYKGPYLRGPRTVEVSLSGDALFVAVDGGPSSVLSFRSRKPAFPAPD